MGSIINEVTPLPFIKLLDAYLLLQDLAESYALEGEEDSSSPNRVAWREGEREGRERGLFCLYWNVIDRYMSIYIGTYRARGPSERIVLFISVYVIDL